jgi:hypothetical protein
MSHAGDFLDPSLLIEPVEAGIAVRVHPSLIIAEMTSRMLAFAVRAELIPSGRWRFAGPGSLIANIGPYSRRRTFTLSLHLNRRVVSKDGVAAANMAAPSRACKHALPGSGWFLLTKSHSAHRTTSVQDKVRCILVLGLTSFPSLHWSCYLFVSFKL